MCIKGLLVFKWQTGAAGEGSYSLGGTGLLFHKCPRAAKKKKEEASYRACGAHCACLNCAKQSCLYLNTLRKMGLTATWDK